MELDSLRGPPPPPTPRPRDPGRTSIPGTRAIFTGAGLLTVFGIMALAIGSQGGPRWKAAIPATFGLLLLALGARTRWRALRLWRRGTCADGQVVHAWEEERGTAEDRRIAYLVSYEYVVDDIQHTGTHATNALWQDGPTWVIYDPANPSDSMPWRGLASP